MKHRKQILGYRIPENKSSVSALRQIAQYPTTLSAARFKNE
jgi:hypothetical protein